MHATAPLQHHASDTQRRMHSFVAKRLIRTYRAHHLALQHPKPRQVPSSRESVDASSAWNQWLRGELPQLFLEATRAFVQRAAAQAVSLSGCCCTHSQLLLPNGGPRGRW